MLTSWGPVYFATCHCRDCMSLLCSAVSKVNVRLRPHASCSILAFKPNFVLPHADMEGDADVSRCCHVKCLRQALLAAVSGGHHQSFNPLPAVGCDQPKAG